MVRHRRAGVGRSSARFLTLRDRENGQAAVETCLLIIIAVAALVVMSVYGHRAYQGYLNVNASSHGLQFDPRRSYDVEQTLSFNQVQDIDITRGNAAIRTFGGQGAPISGNVGRVRGVQAKVTTNWDLQRDATYNADTR